MNRLRLMKGRCLLLVLLPLILLAACDDGARQRLQLKELERMNRADSLMTNDSLALDLAEWFDDYGSPNEQMRAYYLLGRTYADLGEAPQAIEAYNDAADRADTIDADCDYKTLARVHAQKAEIYYNQLLPDNMIHEERYAMQYAKMAKDTMTYIYCYGMLAEGYDMKEMPDSVLQILERAYNLYITKGLDNYAAALCCSMADVYLKKGNIKKAHDALYEFETKTTFFDDERNIEQGREMYYYIKGLYYMNASKLDSAEYYFRKELEQSLDANNIMSSYKGLQKVYEKIGNVDSLTKYAHLFMDFANTIHNDVEMQGMLRLQAAYDYSKKEKTAYQAKIEAQAWHFRFWIVTLSLFVLILASSSGYMYLKSIIRKSELDKRLNMAPVVERMRNCANSNPPSKPTFEDWKELKSLINKEIPSFYFTLNTPEYTLTDMEYDLCLLLRVHMSPTEIYKLKNCSSSYVTTLRIRLLKRIYGEKGSAKDFDRRILSIV